MKKRIVLTAILTFSLLVTAFAQERAMTKLTPIQVSPALVWDCEPWLDGTLVTIDGWGRFSTVEFGFDKSGKDAIKLKPLCEFPKSVVTNHFWVFPESKTICVWDMLMMYVYNQNLNEHDSLVPFLSRRGHFYKAFQLNPDALLLGFDGKADILRHIGYITYNMREKKQILMQTLRFTASNFIFSWGNTALNS